jgi:uncharacterized protein YecE (DUF72 family)
MSRPARGPCAAGVPRRRATSSSRSRPGSSSPTTPRAYRRLRSPIGEADRDEAGGFRTSPIVLRAWERTLACAAILRATAILFQCPASFRPTDENIERLRAFFGTARRPSGVRMLWEPRGEWPADDVTALCRELDLVHVVDPFVSTTVTPQQTYFRLHGRTGARHVYSMPNSSSWRTCCPPRRVTRRTFCSTTCLASTMRGGSARSWQDAGQEDPKAGAERLSRPNLPVRVRYSKYSVYRWASHVSSLRALRSNSRNKGTARGRGRATILR